MKKYFTLLFVVLMLLKCAHSAENGKIGESRAPVREVSDQCRALTSCVECVYDSSVGTLSGNALSGAQGCAWCPTSQTCESMTLSGTKKCPDVVSRFVGYSNKCPDLKCSAVYTTNNLYFCRVSNISAVFFGIVLFIISILFFMWLLTIRQLPWKYPNIHDLVRERTANRPFLAFWSNEKQLVGEEAAIRSSALVEANGTKCPCCHITQIEPLATAEVCFWCEIARVAFIPLLLGFSCSALTLIFTFGLSLKPWFAVWYYAVLLTVPYVAYALFFIYLYTFRVTILGDPSQRLSCFFQLSFILRGRKLTSVFPVDAITREASCEMKIYSTTSSVAPSHGSETHCASSHNDDTVVSEQTPSLESPDPLDGQASKIISSSGVYHGMNENPIQVPSEREMLSKNPSVDHMTTSSNIEEITDIRNRKMAETIHLINTESKIDLAVREKLKKELQHDEIIEWWDEPNYKKIAVDNRWLIHSFITGTAFGIWLFMCSNVSSKEYAITRLMNPLTMMFIGICIALIFLIALFVTVNGCKRTYILTNKRIIIIANGLVGVNLSSSLLSSIEYAAILGYDEYLASGVVLSFSWEQPSGNRHMPPISTNRLPAITDMDEFLVKFRAVSPEITKAEALKENLSHLRKVWRLHIFINMIFLELVPIITIYSDATPLPLTLFGTCIFASLPICLIQRGMRYQQLTYVTLNLKKGWSNTNEDATQRFFRRLREASRKRSTRALSRSSSQVALS